MLIEDVACPVDKLGDMTQDLVDMFQKYGYKDASCFGHALEGNLHLVFSQVGCITPHNKLLKPVTSAVQLQGLAMLMSVSSSSLAFWQCLQTVALDLGSAM